MSRRQGYLWPAVQESQLSDCSTRGKSSAGHKSAGKVDLLDVDDTENYAFSLRSILVLFAHTIRFNIFHSSGE